MKTSTENKRVVLITGCSSGVGLLTALHFARHDDTVYASMRDIQSPGARTLIDASKQEHLDLHVISLDITNENSVRDAMKIVLKENEHIDVLINNAGIMFTGPVELFSIEEAKEQFETNYFGHLRMLKQVIPIMRTQNSGHIINISSINGLISFPLYGIYSSTKFALETMTEALRFELSPFHINVSLVEPGVLLTNLWKSKREPSKHIHAHAYTGLSSYLDTLSTNQEKIRKTPLSKALNPMNVSKAAYSISHQKNPRLHTIVGLDAKLLFFVHQILPISMWNYMLHKMYSW